MDMLAETVAGLVLKTETLRASRACQNLVEYEEQTAMVEVCVGYENALFYIVEIGDELAEDKHHLVAVIGVSAVYEEIFVAAVDDGGVAAAGRLDYDYFRLLSYFVVGNAGREGGTAAVGQHFGELAYGVEGAVRVKAALVQIMHGEVGVYQQLVSSVGGDSAGLDKTIYERTVEYAVVEAALRAVIVDYAHGAELLSLMQEVFDALFVGYK